MKYIFIISFGVIILWIVNMCFAVRKFKRTKKPYDFNKLGDLM